MTLLILSSCIAVAACGGSEDAQSEQIVAVSQVSAEPASCQNDLQDFDESARPRTKPAAATRDPSFRYAAELKTHLRARDPGKRSGR